MQEKEFIGFGSIEQFRNVIKDITHITRFSDRDEEGNNIYNNNKLPTITIYGTEKIHGTNANVLYSNTTGLYVQSKNNIITLEKDNMGYAFFVSQRHCYFLDIILEQALYYGINIDKNIIILDFEFAGGSIQKNSAVEGLPKSAFIFKHFRVVNIETKEVDRYIVQNFKDLSSNNIYNLQDFKTYTLEVDFERPDLANNEFIKLIEEIEHESPVGKQLGFSNNIGEGIVWEFEYESKLYRFKTKGEKHSNSKVKTLKKVDNELEQKKIDFANYACNPNRLVQGWGEVFGTNNEINLPSTEFIGDFLRWVQKDIIKEELDVMMESNLEHKQVSGLINTISRRWFFEQLDKEIIK